MQRAIPAAIALILAGAACGSRELEAPPPEQTEDIDTRGDLPPSTLSVPISYDLSPIIEKLEEVVPVRYGDLEKREPLPSNDRVEFALLASRDPFEVELEGRTARIATTIHYRARAWYDPPIGPTIGASCGAGDDDPPRRVRVSLIADIDLTSDWTLSSRSRVGDVATVSDSARDRCRVTFLQLDMTDRLVQAAQDLLEGHTVDIDRAVASIDVRSNFEEWWSVLQSPIELSDSLWLTINPIAVRRGATAGDGLQLNAHVGLTAQPRIVVGARPARMPAPLPPLDTGTVADGLHILVEGVIDYGVASGFLREQLIGREFSGAGETIRIRDVALSGIGGGRLALRVDFTGDSRGTIYFVGTPKFEPETRQVHVPDLDFDVASEDLRLRGLTWLARDAALQFLRERARFPIGDPIRLGYRYLTEGLNRNLSDDVRLSGEVLSVAPLDVLATRRVLRVRAIAEGTARLTIREPGAVVTDSSN